MSNEWGSPGCARDDSPGNAEPPQHGKPAEEDRASDRLPPTLCPGAPYLPALFNLLTPAPTPSGQMWGRSPVPYPAKAGALSGFVYGRYFRCAGKGVPPAGIFYGCRDVEVRYSCSALSIAISIRAPRRLNPSVPTISSVISSSVRKRPSDWIQPISLTSSSGVYCVIAVRIGTAGRGPRLA